MEEIDNPAAAGRAGPPAPPAAAGRGEDDHSANIFHIEYLEDDSFSSAESSSCSDEDSVDSFDCGRDSWDGAERKTRTRSSTMQAEDVATEEYQRKFLQKTLLQRMLENLAAPAESKDEDGAGGREEKAGGAPRGAKYTRMSKRVQRIAKEENALMAGAKAGEEAKGDGAKKRRGTANRRAAGDGGPGAAGESEESGSEKESECKDDGPECADHEPPCADGQRGSWSKRWSKRRSKKKKKKRKARKTNSIGVPRKKKACRLPFDPRVILLRVCYYPCNLLACVLNMVQVCLVPFICPFHFCLICVVKCWSEMLRLWCRLCCCLKVNNLPGSNVKPCVCRTYLQRYGEDKSGKLENIVDVETGRSKFHSFDIASPTDFDKHKKMIHNMRLIEELRKLPKAILIANLSKDALLAAQTDMVLLYTLGLFDIVTDLLFLLELYQSEGRTRTWLLPVAVLSTLLSILLYLKDLADKHNKTKMLIVKGLLSDHELDLPAISYISNDINTKVSFLVEDIPQICLLAAFVYFTGQPLGTLGKVSYWASSAAVVLKTEVKSIASLKNICLLLHYVLMGTFLLPCFVLEILYVILVRSCNGEVPRHYKRVTNILTLHLVPFAMTSVLSTVWILLSFVLYFGFLA